MLSPLKLRSMYKHDMAHHLTPRTWGPKGKPAPGCSGSICYNHPNVDWTVHRAIPAVHREGGMGARVINRAVKHVAPGSTIASGNKKVAAKIGRRLDTIDEKLNHGKETSHPRAHKVANKALDKAYAAHDLVKHGVPLVEIDKGTSPEGFRKHLTTSSPRWGQGKAPSRMEGRHTIPLPRKHALQASPHAARNTGIGVGVAAAAVGGAYAYKHRAGIKQRAENIASHFHTSHFHHTM